MFRALGADKVVKRLNMGLNDLSGPAVVEVGEALKTNKTLEYLNLGECKLSDESAGFIGVSLNENKALKTLILNDNMIEDRGGLAIGQALLKNDTLREIDLSDNQIGDRGCDGFVDGLLKNEMMEGLNLSNNKLGDMGGQKLLHSVTQNRRIKRLKLAMNTINTKYVSEIEACLKKNIIRMENERRAGVVTQLASLKQEVAKTDVVKKESETLLSQKKKLKREVFEDLKVLNDAQQNTGKGDDDLRQQLEELRSYETRLDQDLVSMDGEIIVSAQGFTPHRRRTSR